MAPDNKSPSLPAVQVDTTPGAYPPTPAEAESPVVVSSQLSLSQAVRKRKAEYTRQHKIRIKVGTWNVASLSGTEKDVGGWFVGGKGVSETLSGMSMKEDEEEGERNDTSIGELESVGSQERRSSKKQSTIPKNDPGSVPGGEEVGIYVLGLQEIVDLGSATEALRPYTDPHPARKWKQAVSEALPAGYVKVAEQQLIGLFLVIYASSSIAPTISSVSTTSVGTGVMGIMGNKGAVTARIILGETTRLVFINCHLTSGVEKGNLERRNWDASQILSRTKFEPVYDGGGVMEEFGEGIGDEDFAFWFGDLNYRLEGMPGDDVRRLLMLHTTNEYGRGQPSKQKIENELAQSPLPALEGNVVKAHHVFEDNTSLSHTTTESPFRPSSPFSATTPATDLLSDPTSLQTTLSSLLTHDQLHSQMRAHKAFHDGWREGPIDFLPTYKYDVGSVGLFDSSEKRRSPSWCDRILFRTRRDRLEYEKGVKEDEEASRKDNEMKLRGLDEAATDEAVLFDYDPETDGANDEDDEIISKSEVVVTKAGFEDRIHLDYYKSHQRVLSSDHKPLDAVFTLDYDAVVPELKAKVHQEVARELDKAENEGRPLVTIVVDDHRRPDSDIASPIPSSPTFEGVDFGHVKYDHPKIRSATIANTGRVPATVGFVDRSVDSGEPRGIAPPWLSIHFDRPSDNHNPGSGAHQEFTLQPGDAANVEFGVRITDLDLVRRLSNGEENLEDVLVLRIHNGRDYFLPLRGKWLQSAFGRSIEKLVRIPEGGVRRLQHQRPDGSSHGDEGVKWSAPREIFRLTEAIEALIERAVAEWDMRCEEKEQAPWKLEAGWPFVGWIEEEKVKDALRAQAREAIDCDQSFQELLSPEADSMQKLQALAETLVHFLWTLEDGIVTEALWTELEKGTIEREKATSVLSNEEERTWVLEVLSSAPAHSVSFNFVILMLTRVADELAPLRGMTDALPPREGESGSQEQSMGQSQEYSQRQRVDKAYADILADAMIRIPASMNIKTRKATELRRNRIVEVFMGSKLVNGP